MSSVRLNPGSFASEGARSPTGRSAPSLRKEVRTMRRPLALLLTGLLVGTLVTVSATAVTRSTWPADCSTIACVNKYLNKLEEQLRLRPLKTAWVGLDEANLEPGTSTMLTAFVPTGSDSRRCLVTFTESNAATTMANAFCGARTVDGGPGVIVRAFLDAPLPQDGYFTLTLYQAGAEKYGEPVPCPLPCGEA
jgi:hypothetical protein